MAYTYEYPRPMVTADVVVARPGAGGREVLLVRRARDPFRGCWALPGGFVGIDEELVDGARRELREETGIDMPPSQLVELGVFGRPGRDPRGRTITIAYLAEVSPSARAVAGDDAAEAAWHAADALPALAFDHVDIVARALASLDARGGGPAP